MIDAETQALAEPTQTDVCSICSSAAVDRCHYCPRPLCTLHIMQVPCWCQTWFNACPECYEKHQVQRGES